MRIFFVSLFSAVPFLACATAPSSNTILNGSYTLDNEGGIIDASGFANTTGYFLESGSINFSNVTLQNFTTVGGSGSGGGAGLGGVIFINNGATVTLNNVIFSANSILGGSGGTGSDGGVLNGLFTPVSNGTAGTNGDNSPTNSGYFNGSNGRCGYSGSPGGNASNGFGGAGGNGGNGSDGTTTNVNTVLVAAQLAAIAAEIALESSTDSSIQTNLNNLSDAIDGLIAAYAVDFAAAGVGAATVTALEYTQEILQSLYNEQQATGGSSDIDTALQTAEEAYQTAIGTTSFQTDGVAGIGGRGGNGADGGNGTFGFGGGAGGSGGSGGDAVTASISSGGNGGDGGNGGAGGFGGGGGLAGSAGSGGANGTYQTVNNGSLNGDAGSSGIAGFGGGTGSIGNGTENGIYGAGGSGYGGAIFVNTGGTLLIDGPAFFDNNYAQGGSSLNSGVAGSTAGTDLFIMRGATVNLNPGESNRVTFNGTIADNSAASIDNASYASGDGAQVNILSGIVSFNGANTYTGQTNIAGGVLQAIDGYGVNVSSNINLAGGVFESSGSFLRFLGTGSNRLQFTGTYTGFSANGADLTVNLNNGEGLTWGTGSFIGNGDVLLFGSTTATNNVIFENNVNLNGQNRTIVATANEENTNEAILNGVISNGSLTINSESYTGTVVLNGASTYVGNTQINGGTVDLNGSLASLNVTVASGATLNDANAGLPSNSTLTNNGIFSMGASQTINSFVNSGTVNGADFTLTAATYLLNNGSVINSHLGTGALTTNGSVTLNETTLLNTVQVNGESTLTLGGAQLLPSSVDVTLNGSLILDGAQSINTFNGDGSVSSDGYEFTVNGGGAFSGSIAITGAPFSVQGGTLNLTNTSLLCSLLDVGNNSTLNFSGSEGNATVQNIDVESGSTFTVSNYSDVTSSGNINVGSNGILNVLTGGELTTDANLTLGSDAILTINSNSSVTADVIMTAAGSVINVPNSNSLTYTDLTGYGTVNPEGNTFYNRATMSGFITVNGHFVNLGTVSPGNSPGVTTYMGNYVESGVLNLAVESTTPGTGYSQIQVSGAVSISPGSTLDVNPYNGFIFAPGDVYQIIATLSGGPKMVTGTYESILFYSDGAYVTNAAVIFDSATGQLISTGLNGPTSTFGNLGSNGNQSNAASAVFSAAQVAPNQINTTTVAGLLARDIMTQQGDPLSYMTPEYYGAAADYAFIGERSLVDLVWNRVSTFRDANECECRTLGFSGFAGYLYNRAHTYDKAHLNRQEFYVGGDFTSPCGLSFGAAVAADEGKIKSDFGHGNMKGVTGLIYAHQAFGSCLTGFATACCSSHDNHFHRPTMEGKVTGHNCCLTWTGNLALEYAGFNFGNLSLAPRINFMYSGGHIDGFKEKGAIDALRNKGYDADLYTGELGLSAYYCTYVCCRELEIELTGGVEQTFRNHKDRLDLVVLDSPDIAYSIEFSKKKRVRGSYGANLGYHVWDGATIYVGYDGFFGGEWDQAVNAGLRVNF